MTRWIVLSLAVALCACSDGEPASTSTGGSGGSAGTGGDATTSQGGSTATGTGGSSAGGGAPTYTVENKYGIDLIHYSRVDKTSRVPNMWIAADSIDAIGPTGELPVGTLIVREENEPVDWIFWKEKRADGWYQADFFPNDPPNFGAGILQGNECLGCHGAPEDTIFTIDMLRRFKETGQFQVAACDQGGNTPCPVGTYD